MDPYHLHFRKADPIIYRVAKQVGPFTVKPNRDRFQMLVASIVSQQLSTKAARTIRMRLEALVEKTGLTPEAVARLKQPQLRAVGLSNNKADYVHDLAHKVASGELQLAKLGRKPDEEVIAELTEVRGIGRWTAQMFLIFSLGRLDVYPHDDLGVRAAIKNLYALPAMPDKTTGHRIAEAWRPYASVASWYCWRSLDLAKEAKDKLPKAKG